MDRQDAKDARDWEEPAGELDAVASSVLQACVEVHRVPIVELKTVDLLSPVHLAQALSYLKATWLRLALVINFNVPVLLRGIRRVVLFAPPSL
jgi:hypothetical protein